MKKLYFLLFICFQFLKGFSQSLNPSTVGEVYNFAVGDTFIYSHGFPVQQYGFTQMEIIIGRTDYPIGDSIRYDKRIITITPMQTITGDTSAQLLLRVDSSIFGLALYPNSCGGSSIDSCRGTDTFYIGNSQFPTREINTVNFLCSPSGGLSETFIEGLGEFSSSFNCYDDWNEIQVSATNNLIYFHKTTGQIWGNPVNFSLGILEPDKPTMSISPNPTNYNFQIHLSFLSPQPTWFKLYDAPGREVKLERISSANTSLSRENLGNGIYFWQVESAGKILGRGKLIFE